MVFLKIFIMSSSNIQKTRGRVQWTPVCPSSPTSSQSIFLSPVPFPTCYGFFFFFLFFSILASACTTLWKLIKVPKDFLELQSRRCFPNFFNVILLIDLNLQTLLRKYFFFFFLNVKHIQFYLYSNNTIWEVWEALLLTLSVPNKTLKHSKMRSFESYTIRPNSC